MAASFAGGDQTHITIHRQGRPGLMKIKDLPAMGRLIPVVFVSAIIGLKRAYTIYGCYLNAGV
jgi:hypothetical protein